MLNFNSHALLFSLLRFRPTKEEVFASGVHQIVKKPLVHKHRIRQLTASFFLHFFYHTPHCVQCSSVDSSAAVVAYFYAGQTDLFEASLISVPSLATLWTTTIKR